MNPYSSQSLNSYAEHLTDSRHSNSAAASPGAAPNDEGPDSYLSPCNSLSNTNNNTTSSSASPLKAFRAPQLLGANAAPDNYGEHPAPLDEAGLLIQRGAHLKPGGK